MKSTDNFDAIVVGSGAGGGISVHVLTQRGLRVLLLDAGRDYHPTSETPMFQIDADAPLNGAPTPDKEKGYYDATVDGGFKIPGEPYTVAPGSHYDWWRARMLGGRTNHWGRVSLRYGPYDFQTHSRDGVGVDWPISYEDLAPFYDRVERLIGIFGGAEGIENSPDSPAGILLPAPALRVHERWMQMVLSKKMGIESAAMRAAILTRAWNGRPACLYATDCHRGCAIGANFQTPTVLLPAALATGRLELRCQAMVYEVTLDNRGRACGVRYIDKLTGAHHLVRARSVVLAASTCETARILLNSRSAAFPNGLANGSGQVGMNLTNTVFVGVGDTIPALQGLPPYNDDGVSTSHMYVPWWGHQQKLSGKLDFATEYFVSPVGGRRMPSVGAFRLRDTRGIPLYGQSLRERLKHEYGSTLTLGSNGGMIPNADSRCDIDPVVKDRWGLAVIRFHWKWGPQELAQARHAIATLTDMMLAMGASKPTVTVDCTKGATLYHELGTARMGATARDSVLDQSGRAWEVRNLYVADGAVFASQACKPPTETMMALAWRASEHLADSFAKREI